MGTVYFDIDQAESAHAWRDTALLLGEETSPTFTEELEMGDVENMSGAETANEQRSRGPAVNEVRLLGRLAADPSVRYTPEGKAVTELRVATNERPEG